MITAEAIAPFIKLLEQELTPGCKIPEWRAHRNKRLREQGIGGIIKEGKKSKSIPPWWTPDTEVWFIDDDAEKKFLSMVALLPG